MSHLGGQRTRNELVMHGLIDDFFEVLIRETIFNQGTAGERMTDDTVDLIEGQPVFNFVFVAF